jgi:hypothetical protein
MFVKLNFLFLAKNICCCPNKVPIGRPPLNCNPLEASFLDELDKNDYRRQWQPFYRLAGQEHIV